MNEVHETRQRRDAASALRAKRRTDAVVAQYLHELSGRHQPAAQAARRARGDDHAKAGVSR